MLKLTRTQSSIALLVITIIWGSGFVVTKYCLSLGLTPGLITGVRGGIFMLLTFAVFSKKILKSNVRDTIIGILAGVTNAGAYILQAVSLKSTTPSVSAFLTIMHIVFVPIMALLIYRKKPLLQIYPAIIIALAGTAILTGVSFKNFNMGKGEWLSLGGAASFALSIAIIGNSGRKTEPLIIGFWMGLCQLVISGLYFIFAEKAHLEPVSWTAVILPLAYLGVIGTFVTTNVQVISQKSIDETTAAIIMSMEAVFGSVISLIFGYDKFSWSLLTGGILIFAGVLIAIIKFQKLAERLNLKDKKPSE